jgi:succinate dehydrogenase/fumarate reductase flavoprotein subunit
MEMTRRSFVTAAGAVAGAAAVAGSSVAHASEAADSSAEATETSSEASSASGSSRPDYYMCDEDWLGSAPEVASADITETKSYDVVVVGGGHAGTQAALAAAQNGAKVAVIEKHADGEIIYRGDDICSYNSDLMLGWGFGPYDLDEIVNEYVRRANGRCNTGVIRRFVYNSADMMNNIVSLIPDTSNLLDRDGGQCIVQIAYDTPDGSSYPLERGGYKMWASTLQTVGTKNPNPVGKAGLTDVSRLTEIETYCRDAAEDLGAEWFCGYTGVECVLDDSGAVTGVIAQDSDGAYVEFDAAKGVILATGDFGANNDMVWELCSECAENAMRHGVERESLTGMTDCDGSGHKMGCWAGGAIESHPRPVAGDAPSIAFGPWGSTPCLWLNCKGERFMNEEFAGLLRAQSVRQPIDLNATMVGNFAIMDTKYMQYIQLAGLDHGAPNWGWEEGIETFQQDMEALDPAQGSGDVLGLEIAQMGGGMSSTVYVGETVEDALANAGLEGDALQAAVDSVARYNEMCAAGTDTDFGKDADLLIPIDEGPFYVATQGTQRLYGPGLNTLAGLCVDSYYRVLNANKDAVIPGLYAVGNTMGERYGNAYNTPSAGNNMGNALTSGRVAGKHAAGAVDDIA